MSNWRPIKTGVKNVLRAFISSKLLSLRHFPKYMSDYRAFERLGGRVTKRFPILTEYSSQAGIAGGHYFHQDLLVASFIYKAAPRRHIDIGSRIDGFIAHVAAFRKIEVLDVRNLESTGHENIEFKQMDLMSTPLSKNEATDSVSCLHAIEHFGLGRYGDSIDPQGHIKGFNNIVDMLATQGILYISFPIGKENEVHFNAHRVFHPKDILKWSKNPGNLRLERFDYVDDAGNLNQNIDLLSAHIEVKYGCGIYTFRKLH